MACEKGGSPAVGTVITPGSGLDSISRCQWIHEISRTGNLTNEMVLQLSGDGLAENRDAEAYVANITYVLIHNTEKSGARQRREYTVPIFASVLAVPVAARSVRGLVPSGGRCETTPTANNTGAVAVMLGQTAIVPFSLCDLQGLPTNQPALAGPSWGLSSTLHRNPSPSRSLRIAAPHRNLVSESETPARQAELAKAAYCAI